MKAKQKSFTLIEVLVVIAIIGLLSAITLVALREVKEKARIARGLQFSSQVHHALGADGTGFYDLDSIDGETINDTSGNKNHGEIVHNGGNIDIVEGIVGNALELTGGLAFSGDYVEVLDPGDNSSLDFTEGITIQAWIKLYDTYNADKRDSIVSKPGVMYFHVWNGFLFFDLRFNDGLSDEVRTYVQVFENDKWYHVVATYNGSKMKLFVDGKEVASKDVPDKKLAANNKPLGIGAMDKQIGHPYLFFYFNGVMDEVRIYCGGFF